MKKLGHGLISSSILATCFALVLLGTTLASAQLSPVDARAATLDGDYNVTVNVVYLTANNYQNKLDVYQPNDENTHPTLIYIHGGGWVAGTKEDSVLGFVPFLEKGWAVVNVEYRLAKVSPAPAAVEDCRCALHWVVEHAKDYKFDTNRIVIMGASAGGHLSLTTGMLPASAGLDRECSIDHDIKVAAIIDWFGITDVNELLAGPNTRDYAVNWLGSQPDRDQIAKRVSPLTYVRPGLPPTLIVHGDADSVVPYPQSVRLQKELDKAGVPNELITVHGGDHGGFNHAEMERAYEHIWAFLAKNLPKAP
jgi:acetyl esterase/lipase